MAIQEFDKYYGEIFGSRWPRLKAAMMNQDLKVARKNKWVSDSDFYTRNPTLKEIPQYIDDCWRVGEKGEVTSLLSVPQGTIPRSADGLLDYYIMDPASVLTARALPVTSAEKILDLCAAPGGKTLILFESANPGTEMWSNEFSSGRREQLTRVVKQYIPFEERKRFWVKGMDGEKVGMRNGDAFDSILVDAPCSGEKHILASPKDMDEWSVKRGKNLARRQFSLLSSAWLSLKSGGYLLYSTCSINPIENEKVIEEFLSRREGEIEVIEPTLEIKGEKPARGEGVYYLPDECGFGPMYLCLMRRL